MYSCHRARVPRIVARCVPIRSINETVDVWSLKSTHGPNTGYLDVAILHARHLLDIIVANRLHEAAAAECIGCNPCTGVLPPSPLQLMTS
eukprot:COSAG01_NODE_23951_length_795_cov_18.329023_2_plen_90_part_00